MRLWGHLTFYNTLHVLILLHGDRTQVSITCASDRVPVTLPVICLCCDLLVLVSDERQRQAAMEKSQHRSIPTTAPKSQAISTKSRNHF